jgi:hypothetical protein
MSGVLEGKRLRRRPWWLSVALGLVAALLHWPIDERAVPRLQT